MNQKRILQEPVNEQARKPGRGNAHDAYRWAIILAGGDGTRLRQLTQVIAGDNRPKQFCSVLGNETLLDQTRRRVALGIRPQQTLFVLTRSHEHFYIPHLKGVPDERLVVQPRNAGTAPAILYALLRVSHLNPDAVVAIFPSDHYVSDDVAFMSHIETAFESVAKRKDLVVLLGIQPDRPETEYGWIEPLSPGLPKYPDALNWVRRFSEKPAPELATVLMKRGWLWNSFVMVGRVSAFLEMIRRAVPDLLSRFQAIETNLNTSDEERVVNKLYSDLPNINFSHEVLAARTGRLAVLPVTGLKWNDLGKPQRVLSTMAEMAPSGRNEQPWASIP